MTFLTLYLINLLANSIWCRSARTCLSNQQEDFDCSDGLPVEKHRLGLHSHCSWCSRSSLWSCNEIESCYISTAQQTHPFLTAFQSSCAASSFLPELFISSPSCVSLFPLLIMSLSSSCRGRTLDNCLGMWWKKYSDPLLQQQQQYHSVEIQVKVLHSTFDLSKSTRVQC